MNDRFLRACRRQPVDTTPVWIMRQAGRYLPEYMEVRRKHDFLTVCKTPELAARVTLQPVERLGVDAAILFSDILIPIEAMGVPLQFLDKKGPVLGTGVRDRSAVAALRVPDPVKSLGFVMDAIRVLRGELAGKVPLIGFSGLPFTLASYMVEGGKSKDFAALRSLMKDDPRSFALLMEKLTDTTIAYLGAQVAAGAQAIQIFDTWAGILAALEYQARVFPYSCRVAEAVRGLGVPVIHFTESCGELLPVLKELPVDVLSIDWRVPLDQAAGVVGQGFALQGNLAPETLLEPAARIESAAADILERGRRAGGHIFNLGHGILPKTDPEKARFLVETVHRLGKR
jgi:uroporphyrinogen decarboxylase